MRTVICDTYNSAWQSMMRCGRAYAADDSDDDTAPTENSCWGELSCGRYDVMCWCSRIRHCSLAAPGLASGSADKTVKLWRLSDGAATEN
eukprot:COSAG05_NODE_888_length_6737_cov_9.635583_1_plen_90_part_00